MSARKRDSGWPIRPGDIDGFRTSSIPPFVFDAFNELIEENYSDGEALVKQDKAIAAITKRMKGGRDAIFENFWLCVEGAYRKEGWWVTFDKPGNDEEPYEPFYVFRRSKS